MLPALQASGGLSAENNSLHLKEVQITGDKSVGKDSDWQEGSCHIFDGYGSSLQISKLRYQVSQSRELTVEMQPEGSERQRLGKFVRQIQEEDSGYQIVLMVNREIAEVPRSTSFFPRWLPVPLPGKVSEKNIARLKSLVTGKQEIS